MKDRAHKYCFMCVCPMYVILWLFIQNSIQGLMNSDINQCIFVCFVILCKYVTVVTFYQAKLQEGV
jgi:hypothetical protein